MEASAAPDLHTYKAFCSTERPEISIEILKLNMI